MKKLFLIFALLPAFAFAQNAVVSVMPGYSFASKMQGPALSVNYSQAWKGKSGYSQHWIWLVGLASYNGVEKEVDYLGVQCFQLVFVPSPAIEDEKHCRRHSGCDRSQRRFL